MCLKMKAYIIEISVKSNRNTEQGVNSSLVIITFESTLKLDQADRSVVPTLAGCIHGIEV